MLCRGSVSYVLKNAGCGMFVVYTRYQNFLNKLLYLQGALQYGLKADQPARERWRRWETYPPTSNHLLFFLLIFILFSQKEFINLSLSYHVRLSKLLVMASLLFACLCANSINGRLHLKSTCYLN